MNEKKEGHAARLRVLRNAVYLTTFKAFLLLVISVFTFLSFSQFAQVMTYYRSDKQSVINAFTQGPHFDYRTSAPFRAEVKNALQNILQYALVYQDPEHFSNADTLILHIEEETARADDEIGMVTDLAAFQVETGNYQNEFLENGFIQLENGGAAVDEEAIRSYYEALRDKVIESYKVRSDETYSQVKATLDALHGVQFAVVDHTADAFVTNTGTQSAKAAQQLIAKSAQHLVLFDSRQPYFTATSMKDVAALAQELAEDDPHDFDLFVSFPDDLHFNASCDTFEENCRSMYQSIFSCLVKAAVFTVCIIGLSAWLLFLAGKRESGGAIKYAVTDRLPNELHFLFQFVLMLSMVVLIDNSIYILLNPQLGTTFITLHPDYFLFRAKLCAVALVATALNTLCVFKRHYRNHTLLSNTLVHHLFRALRKNGQPAEDDPPEPLL